MTDTAPPPSSPLTPEQRLLLDAAIRMVQSSPDGCGEIIITVKSGNIRFITPAPHLDTQYPEREEKWIRS